MKCSPDDTVGDLKKLIAAQKGTKPEKVGWIRSPDFQALVADVVVGPSSTDRSEKVVQYVSFVCLCSYRLD